MTSFNPTDMYLEDSILGNFGGPVINNLNHILGNTRGGPCQHGFMCGSKSSGVMI